MCPARFSSPGTSRAGTKLEAQVSSTFTVPQCVVKLARALAGTICILAVLGQAGTARGLPPDQGPGGPILVIAQPTNPFTRYYAEILRTEGLNAFAVADIGSVSAATLSAYDVVILGEMSLTAAQVTMLSNWVTGGGNLIAMRPDAQLNALLGLASAGSPLSNAYLLINTGSEPGAGLVNQTIQFHGAANRYTLSGATSVATLYSNPTTATANPAVTVRTVSTNGGQAAAFAYDLARSVVYTRQGNPAWAGQERDAFEAEGSEGDVAAATIRSDDMFFGNASFDPEPDWIDLNKVQIPQADEQQRLLANLIQVTNRDRKPLPRFWYFPRGKRAVVIMTGDEHSCCDPTVERFQTYVDQSPPGCSLADWECVRASSYIYTSDELSDAEALSWTNLGFELGVHVNTGCENWTPAELESFFADQFATFTDQFPSIPPPSTNRTHCGAWSDWSSEATVSLNNGVRLDTTYYYWPPSWLQDRPGMFTGSGMPMRFAGLTGTIIDVYQATTQMTDESGQSYPFTIDTLLDNAVGGLGYYGAFTANMHTDFGSHPSSDLIVQSALDRNVPVVSARQMLNWLDGRNASTFSAIQWNVNTLSFTIGVGPQTNGIEALVPMHSARGILSSITRNGGAVSFTTETTKGLDYARFSAAPGNYVVTYPVPGDDDGDGYAEPEDCNDADPNIFPGAPERCNGMDDNCNGQTDENFPTLGNACSVGVGACHANGVRVCSNDGLSTVCSATPGTPTAELCNGIDDDCDGQTDEDFPTLGNACSVGVGACQANGVRVCSNDGLSTVCNATPGTPTTEVCDGVDNDCDGQTDEGTSGAACNTGLLGACAAGTVQCQAGVPHCVQNTPATAETCNGIDDDCDGTVDDNNPGGGGACDTGLPGVCSAGTYQCQMGSLQCHANASVPEVCDGVDNDCDGTVDNGNPGGGGPCPTGLPGACATGTEQCQGGTLVCVPPTPGVELCASGVDEDCDGEVDESDCVPCTPANTVTLATQTKKTIVRVATGSGQVKTKGTFILPSAGLIDPAAEAVGLWVTDGSGALRYQGVLPAGSFTGTGGGRTFKFTDPTQAFDGMRSAKLGIKHDQVTVKYSFKAKGVDVPAFEAGTGTLTVQVGEHCFVDSTDVCTVSGTTGVCK